MIELFRKFFATYLIDSFGISDKPPYFHISFKKRALLQKALVLHTQSIITPIQSEIIYKQNRIKIDRTQILTKLKDQLDKTQTVIIAGEAGSGKTAIVKDWYNELKEDSATAFFVFKATEFNIAHINDLFKNYGNFTLLKFIKECGNNKKYIVIDSAERLSDLENQEPFKEFLSSLFQNAWKVIFTTRYRYFDDLKFQLCNVHTIIPYSINVPKFSADELTALSQKHNFNIPTNQNQKLLELLQTPLYLKEYLKKYSEIRKGIDYLSFKKILWNNIILKSSYQEHNIHIQREKCFLNLVKKRVNESLFFINIDSFENRVLQALTDDEIIKYNSRSGGYFITHDIYEEWALEKIIERDFHNREDYKLFLNNIGDSLPIRRAFRGWLSEKLYIKDQEVKNLIANSVQNNDLERHWKDEILVSVLLSDYCFHFFKIFESKLLKESQSQNVNNESQNNLHSHYELGLLYKLLFLLRLACKEADESVFDTYGLPKTYKNKKIIETIFTKPRGKGWNCMIAFLNKNKKHFKLQYINLIVPVLEDWNKNKKGETTKNANQLALFYYEKIMDEEYNFKYDDLKKRLIKIIFNGSFEVKEDLKNIFQLVISKKETDHNSRYYQLVHTILTAPMESVEVIKNFPAQVIQLAKLFWIHKPKKENLTLRGILLPEQQPELEECFSIIKDSQFNHSSSAFQTPILWLINFSYKQTIDFILSFTNQSIESFSNSRFKNELETVEIIIDEKTSVKQYINNRLWGIYRGTQVAPYLLISIHMALERYFLHNCKDMDSSELEKKLLYLLKNSKSASISAVVASVVLAYPQKTFNIAKILFQIKQFFLYDQIRWITDQSSMNTHLSYFKSDILNQILTDERNKSNKLPHRKSLLEHLALEYQLFKIKPISDKKFSERQKTLWKILDEHYNQLPALSKETDHDKTWKLCLARMDKRKMNPQIKEENGQKLLYLNPEIDPNLKKHSEQKQKKNSDLNQYLQLQLWAKYRLENKEEYKQKAYLRYKNDPNLVIKETKDIIKKLENIPGDSHFPFFSKQNISLKESYAQNNDKQRFRVLNQSIPLYTCSVLIRDYLNELSQEQKNFCKKIIMDSISYLIKNNTHDQPIADKDIAIQGLSFLFHSFPTEILQIKKMLLSLLIEGEGKFESPSIKVITDMWDTNFEDANSLFLGYLLLKQKFDKLSMEEYQLANRNLNYNFSQNKFLFSFLKKNHKKELEEISNNRITYQKVSNVCNFKDFYLDILIKAFKMLPLKVENQDHKEFIKDITLICIETLFTKNKKTNNYELKVKFLELFSSFILNLQEKEIPVFLKPFLDNFDKIRISEYREDFFSSFVFAQDRLNQYENFWIVWNLFYPKIIQLCKTQQKSDFDKEIIYNYLLAGNDWKQEAKDWHSLKDREEIFFEKISKEIGHYPSVLYSIVKVLNSIGSSFQNKGIFWISDIIKNNPSLSKIELKTNTVFYMENIIRGYIFRNRGKIKNTPQIKKQVLIILNFLVEKGSAVAYRLRENIL